MKFKILNRNKAKRFSYDRSIEPCIIISITDVESYPINFCKSNQKVIAILPMKFDDVDFGEVNCITPEDGRTIIQFVNRYIDKVSLVVVNCEAGISRSAGICAALMKIINDSDMEVFDSLKYSPNMSCYRTVLEQYYGYYDESEANRKYEHNIRIYKEKYLE